MITIVYSTHKDENYNNKFKQHLIQTSGLKDVQVIEYVNHNQFSLSQVYNSGITESIYDIVVCCHNDIKLEKNWGKKLLEDFSKNPEFGIIGKAGSCYFSQSGVYWERMSQTMVGQVYHHPEGSKKWLSRYSVKSPNITPVVTIDGLFISFDKTKIKHQFDETIGRFHFYDHLFCMPNYLDGVGIGVTSSFDITHESVGQPNQEFWDSREKFIQKWGGSLPLELEPKIFIPEIVGDKKQKKLGKVAVVIPTKGKVEMLYECVKSFYEKSNSELFDVFIADTGSTDDEKDQIREQIVTLGNVKLIEYDYYNFAKINNDVVNNHVDDSYEFILFSNNDIKILNDVITGMSLVYTKDPKAGTVGCRLHFGNGTIQHDGVFLGYSNTKQSFSVGHNGLGSHYNYQNGIRNIFGVTGGLLMIRKKLFQKLGGFNEKYISCFEDVELNIMSITNGYKNYINSDCVSYHYESTTRNEDPDNLKKLQQDYVENLFPCITSNVDKLRNYITIVE